MECLPWIGSMQDYRNTKFSEFQHIAIQGHDSSTSFPFLEYLHSITRYLLQS